MKNEERNFKEVLKKVLSIFKNVGLRGWLITFWLVCYSMYYKRSEEIEIIVIHLLALMYEREWKNNNDLLFLNLRMKK